MDPNLFHIDWERTLEALTGIVLLAFLVERACSLLLESEWWINKFDDQRVGRKPNMEVPEKPNKRFPFKEIIGFAVALILCWSWDFDALSIILLSDSTKIIGIIVTAAVIAGGSKASLKLFQDVFKTMSSAKVQRNLLKKEDLKKAGLQ